MARGLSAARTSTRPGRHSRCATQLIASSTNIADNCKNLFTLCRGSEPPRMDDSQSFAAIEPKADFAFGSACAPMPNKAGQTLEDNPDSRQSLFSPGTAQNTISLPISSDRDQSKAPMIKQAASSGKSQPPAGPDPLACGSDHSVHPSGILAAGVDKTFPMRLIRKKPEQAKTARCLSGLSAAGSKRCKSAKMPSPYGESPGGKRTLRSFPRRLQRTGASI